MIDTDACNLMGCDGTCNSQYIIDDCFNCTLPSTEACVLGCIDIAATNYNGALSCIVNFDDLNDNCVLDFGEDHDWIEGCVAATEQEAGSCIYPDALYVSYEGFNSNTTNCGPGTEDAPLTSVQEAIDRAERLDEINVISLFPYTYEALSLLHI